MVEGSLYVDLVEERSQKDLRGFKYLMGCLVEQELDWIWVNLRDGIRSNSKKYQGNSSRGEKSIRTVLIWASLPIVGSKFADTHRFDVHLGEMLWKDSNI